jgi:DNA-binding response OmpR family regulator
LLPDLILLDLMLPKLDGFTVCEILRRQTATANIPVIMLTAASGELSRLHGLETGANDYVTKPFSPRNLVSRVQKQLQFRSTKTKKQQLKAASRRLANRMNFVVFISEK